MEYSLVCSVCGARYDGHLLVWRCACGHYLDLDFHPIFDKKRLPDVHSMWRYRQVLPLKEPPAVTCGESITPLVPLHMYGMDILGKADFLLPTGSFKDRGAAVMIHKCKELGIEEVVEDSSGNAAGAVAAYCAREAIKAHIYMPAGNSTAKRKQARAYGAVLHLVEGSREDCTRAALAHAERSYYASHAFNPFFLHGTKTFLYEIVEQLHWRVPDYIVVPVGSGTQILGARLALHELSQAGLIDRLPRLIAVQSTCCCPLKCLAEGTAAPQNLIGHTLAEGIVILHPARQTQIMQAVRETGGSFLTVEDAQIVEAQQQAALQGVYVEPTAAVGLAAVQQLAAIVRHGETMVVSLTGSGLKTQIE